MSLAKAVPNGLNDHKFQKITPCKCPPIPYVPKKDCVQQMISALKDKHLKMQIGKSMELQVSVWHSGMHEAFPVHVGSA